ncbi:hypothetical protein [Mongoliimonas terrestris]|uniref:hypothetical protein n=1 Tax=Mongoliimonas terrestris TaxID=1709001 RepID=UPI000949925A|nr:hypothetical protein [Mongoliimonas terrestris]
MNTAIKISALAAAIAFGASSASAETFRTNAGAANTNPSETTQQGNVTEQLAIQNGTADGSAVGTNDAWLGRSGGAAYGSGMGETRAFDVSPRISTNPTESERGDSTIEELQKR